MNAIRRRLDAIPAETRARIFKVAVRLFVTCWFCTLAAFVWYFTGFEHVAVRDDVHTLEWNDHGTWSYVRPAHARIFYGLLVGGCLGGFLCAIVGIATEPRDAADAPER